jgi:2-(1,2-epoxy-1,2-dihydrophenyl)acetyl-CoA isomerase
MPAESELIVEKQSNHYLLTINRPHHRNALTRDVIEHLKNALHEARDDTQCRSVVIRGAGGTFCSGDDIGGMGSAPEVTGADRRTRFIDYGYPSAVREIRDLRKPVIGVIEGYALGAGCELAMCTDIRIVAKTARIGIPFALRGFAGATYILPSVVGVAKATEMLFTARVITGAELSYPGFATELVEEDEVDAAMDRWTTQFGRAATGAIGLMKRAIYRAPRQPFEEGFADCAAAWILSLDSPDRAEGRAAWRERRDPVFGGT